MRGGYTPPDKPTFSELLELRGLESRAAQEGWLRLNGLSLSSAELDDLDSPEWRELFERRFARSRAPLEFAAKARQAEAAKPKKRSPGFIERSAAARDELAGGEWDYQRKEYRGDKYIRIVSPDGKLYATLGEWGLTWRKQGRAGPRSIPRAVLEKALEEHAQMAGDELRGEVE